DDELNVNDKNKSKDVKNNSQLEKIKCGLYFKSKTLMLTYYNKYEPNGSFTNATAGTKKITSFFNNIKLQIANSQPLESNDLDVNEISSDSESETNSYTYKINKKTKNLKKQLEQNHNELTVKEYNYKRVIFEYLSLLSYNNGCGKIKASLEVYERSLLMLLPSRHGKYQKTIRIIDDKDIKSQCYIWIRSQNFKVIPVTFKKFIENEFLS
ncbi:19016_t:CDS:2, partial [Gigaspora margarita]